MAQKKIKFVNGQMFEYTIYDLVDKYSDILKQKTIPFDFSNPPIGPWSLANSLIETMIKNFGVGLSANQVGLPYRVFAMGAENVSYVLFNPQIVETYGEDNFEEGCLSFPGLFLPIKRPSSVKVKYQDPNGNFKEETFGGFTARIFLHEYDHMEGILFTNHVNSFILERQKKKVKGNLKKLKEQRIRIEQARKKTPQNKTA
jgi:peptide deformylase